MPSSLGAQPQRASTDPASAETPTSPPVVDTLPAQVGRGDVAVSVVPERLIPGSEFPVASWERYEFIKLLGRGGMGAVYQARDRRLNRLVALKFIHSANPQMTSRFLQEARAQAHIDHRNVCKVYEVGEVERQPYIAMQLVNGPSLSDAAAVMNLTDKVVLMRQVAEAMHEAHKLGIIHRDLKPDNILVEHCADGLRSPVIMDFGLARDSTEGQGLTETGAVMGTPAYMAPEQARGDVRTIDRRSDVYSLGATLYELIAGTPPFTAAGVVELLLCVLHEEVRPLRTHLPSVPLDLETIVMKCLHKEPSQRYDSAKALAEDLGRYLNGEPIVGKRLGFARYLQRRLRQHRGLVLVATLSLLVVLGLGANLLRQRVVVRRERTRAAEQSRLERDLAQQIKDMEWLLRSARQLSLHDLGREKSIVRRRMAQLQAEFSSYGELGRALAHYALGRGHMALHEYPQALAELQQAIAQGNQSAEVHYALGLVLGKHFEQAMYEARLSGGGEWAKKQLKELEPRYLTPAIASLQRSRALKFDAPGYLEGLIAFYQRDYPEALRQADAALGQAPWLYEAAKLAGDVHLEQALQARDRGERASAESEFAAAVQRYQEAAREGRSDADVYEGLAETWVRQIETARDSGQPIEKPYAAAVAAIELLALAEPQSVSGWLKRAFAAMLSLGSTGGGLASEQRVKECLTAAEAVMQQQPAHPYARDVAAECYLFAAEAARAAGANPEPLWGKALHLLEPAVQKYPHFLWGFNDLGGTYQQMGSYARLTGQAAAKDYLFKSIYYLKKAIAVDETYGGSFDNVMAALTEVVLIASSDAELQLALAQAEDTLTSCKRLGMGRVQCYNNYFQVYVRAALRREQAGQDPQPQLTRAAESLATLRKLGGSFLDAEQHAALAQLVAARRRVHRGEDPAPALVGLQAALEQCFAIARQDTMCRTVATQADWVTAQWLVLQRKPARTTQAVLLEALRKALLATQSLEIFPDAWQVLAETYLRLASVPMGQTAPPGVFSSYLSAARSATQKLFSMNPHHGPGWVTAGSIELLHAQLQREPGTRRTMARAAVAAFEQAMRSDVLLGPTCQPLLAQARAL